MTSLTHPWMSKFDMGMGPNFTLVKPRPLIIALPNINGWTLESNNTLWGWCQHVDAPFNWNIPSSLCTTITPRMILVRSMVGHARRSWNLGTIACQDSIWTLDTFVRLALKTRWTIGGTKLSFNLTITSSGPPFPHNMAVKWNMAANSWIPKMAMSQ